MPDDETDYTSPDGVAWERIYGDGHNTAYISKDSVMLRELDTTIIYSRHVFREVVIGWERVLDEEAAG